MVGVLGVGDSSVGIDGQVGVSGVSVWRCISSSSRSGRSGSSRIALIRCVKVGVDVGVV